MNKGKAGKLKNLFYDLLIVAGAALLLWGGGNALLKYLGEEKDKELYEQLNENFVNRPTESEDEISIVWGAAEGAEEGTGTIWYRQGSVDFDGLNAINPEVVGWLFFENEEISYPILYSGDNDYYLHRTLYKEYSESGSIFLEAGNAPGLQDRVTIIYGHNMKNGSMFGRLRYYKEIEDYYEDHQYFQILTEDGRACRYRVFSYFDVDQYEVEMVDVESYSTESSGTDSSGGTAEGGEEDSDGDEEGTPDKTATDKPGGNAAGSPGRTAADKPGGDAEGSQGRTATDKPGGDAAGSPEKTATDKPDGDAAGMPERNAADKPDEIDAGKPERNTADKSDGDAADKANVAEPEDTGGNTVRDPGGSGIESAGGGWSEEPEGKNTGGNQTEEPEGKNTGGNQTEGPEGRDTEEGWPEEPEGKSAGEDRAEETEREYEKYLEMLQERSLIHTNVPVGTQDRVVGLYTCSSDQGNRLSVYGVLESEHDFNEILEESLEIRTLDR